MLRSFLLAGALAVSACSATGPQDPRIDAGGADAAPVPTRELVFDPPSVRAQPGARVPVTVTLRTRDGAPVAGEEVRLALLDGSRDASLSQTRVVTDGAGRAGFELIASSVSTTFSVRATVAPTYTFTLYVSVSDRGFGSVSVTSRYTGGRGPDRVDLALYHGRGCAELDDSVAPLRTVALGPAGGQVTFGSLGAGQSFTVHGVVLGAAGDLLASGCIDSLVPTADGDLGATLTLTDLPLTAAGAYHLSLAFDLGTLPTMLSAGWTRALAARAPMGDVTLVLDAIADAVGAHGGSAAEAEFNSARDRLTTDLRADFVRRAASPLAALYRLASDTAAVLEGIDGLATLDVRPGGAVPALVDVRDVTYTLDPLTPDVASDDLTLVADMGGGGTITPQPGDRAEVALDNVRLPLVAASRRAADALLGRLGVASATEWAQVTVRCAEVVAVVGAAASAGGCNTACVVAACNSAAAELGAAFDAALAGPATGYEGVQFVFEGAARGVPGTLRLQSIEPSAFTGLWLNTSGMPMVPVLGVARLSAL